MTPVPINSSPDALRRGFGVMLVFHPLAVAVVDADVVDARGQLDGGSQSLVVPNTRRHFVQRLTRPLIRPARGALHYFLLRTSEISSCHVDSFLATSLEKSS